jgi:MFS family permease
MILAHARIEHPLRNRRFRRFWVGLAGSFFGDQFYLLALPWIVLQTTGSALTMSSILATGTVPRLALFLVGGTVSDRFSPRKILIASTLARALLVTGLGALLFLHWLKLWELYLLALAFGAADAFSIPAGEAYLPTLLDPEQLPEANSVLETTIGLITVFGSGPAAVAVKILGTASAFFFDSISFLGLGIALWTLPDQPVLRQGNGVSMWRSIQEGIRYFRGDALLYALAMLAAVVNLCLEGPLTVGLPYLAESRFHSAGAFAALLSSLSGGRILGALLAGFRRIVPNGVAVLGGSALSALCLACIGFFPSLLLLCINVFLLGASAGFVDVYALSWMQQRVEAAFRGRVVSLLMLVSFGLAPVSMTVAGLMAKWNLRLMFALAGLASLCVIAISTRSPGLRQMKM